MYLIESDVLWDERDRLTSRVDRLNGEPNEWAKFDPHLTIGVVNKTRATENLRKSFVAFMPEILTLQKLEAVTA